MSDVVKIIEMLQKKLDKYRDCGLKETPTRTNFIDPLLTALGWNCADNDEVAQEYSTFDTKSADYAMRINRKLVLVLEAKQLFADLEEPKSITQVVNYANNEGIEWGVLTNGVRYRVYKATEIASAPEKLLFDVTIDPCDPKCLPVAQIASKLEPLSKTSMANGVLDKLSTEIFPARKVRKVLRKLFGKPPPPLILLIRDALDDKSVTPSQIQQALGRIDPVESTTCGCAIAPAPDKEKPTKFGELIQYSEDHHTKGKPSEVIELYHGLDRLCQSLCPRQRNARLHGHVREVVSRKSNLLLR